MRYLHRVGLVLILLIVLPACTPRAATARAGTAVATAPAILPSPTVSIVTATPAPGRTAIAGTLSYPSEFIPELRVVAFDIATGKTYFIDTVQNQSSYRIQDLPAGVYHVVAYLLDPASTLAAGYTRAVPCGLLASCSDHTLIDVVVKAGLLVENIDPGDWYAPVGSFPVRPGP
jgi:hypothetical protein